MKDVACAPEHDEKTRDYATTTLAVIGGLTGGGIAVANCFKDRVACAADAQRGLNLGVRYSLSKRGGRGRAR